ncbi:amidohydrolase family protein [Nocardia crassostreae]|uniref:amidohydrolase family protein n=1 Tax=Nocardia crassostreae TaxID=53428 RepID=UPI000A9C1208|nr:amidohydrolase family protein [Nocardia crassostreae]
MNSLVSATDSSKKALVGVRVFDGSGITGPTTVVIDGPVVGSDAEGAERIDAQGALLLPGFIDAHIHLHGPESLDQLAAYGVTTGLDMTTWPVEKLAALRNVRVASDIRSAGVPVIGGGGVHAQLPGLAADAVITGPEQADRMVAERAAAGSDYVKLVLEAPGQGGPEPESAAAVVAAAHARDLRVIAHATAISAYALAAQIGVDVVTHVPLDGVVPAEVIRLLADRGLTVVPTLVMMEGIAAAVGAPEAFDGCLATVRALHEAGVPVLAGTDANAQPGVLFQPPHGAAIHRELELLVAAGLTPAEALRAATLLPAEHFGLPDRGLIEPGLRADLVLLDGDPLTDIRATRRITRVWCEGVEHDVAKPEN